MDGISLKREVVWIIRDLVVEIWIMCYQEDFKGSFSIDLGFRVERIGWKFIEGGIGVIYFGRIIWRKENENQ